MVPPQCAVPRKDIAERSRRSARAGLDPEKALVEVIIPTVNAEGGEYGVLMLAQQRAGLPPAIFCLNDQVALGVLRALQRRGLSVPDDVAVVGYDDVEFAPMLSPPLTSVRQPMYKLGHTAASLLLAETHDSHHRHQRVPYARAHCRRPSSQRNGTER